MNKDDKFIKEKLDLAEQIDNPDLEVTETLRERSKKLVMSVSNSNLPKNKRLKTRLITVLTSCTAVITGIVVLCVLLIPKQNEDTLYYYDENLKSYILSYNEMVEDYDFLHPEMDYYDAGYNVNKDKDTQVAVFATMEFALPDGDLEVTVILVNNYTYVQSQLFDKQVTEPATTELFSYKYKIFEGVGLAKCEYAGYKYFFEYTSDYPEDINYIMSSLTIK